jgi:hypothetical protein
LYNTATDGTDIAPFEHAGRGLLDTLLQFGNPHVFFGVRIEVYSMFGFDARKKYGAVQKPCFEVAGGVRPGPVTDALACSVKAYG